MLKRLKRQFVLITVVLGGIILLGVLGSTLYSTWSTQRDIINQALDRAVNDDLDHMPMIGDDRHDGGRGEGGGAKNLLALAVDVSEDGMVIKTSRAPVAINSTVLKEVVAVALSSEEDTGRDGELHVAWKRRLFFESIDLDNLEELGYEDLGYTPSARIAIVDTSAMDSALSEQVKSDVIITIVALIALFGVAWFLSSLALAPVARAWEDQRRFVSDASHELKTPLAVILANTEILLNDEEIPAESRRWVESTADEASLMRSLVNDLLELARTDEGASGGAMRKEDVDLSLLVESAALEFDAVAFEHGCLIEEQVEPGIQVQGDPEWLTRLTKILIDNACKYAQAGTTIGISLSHHQSHAVLSVSNQGNPIDAEDLEHIFDRFYRSDKARTRETGGFGLGLAIAKGIAEAHGGKIAATSSEAEGTTFTVTL